MLVLTEMGEITAQSCTLTIEEWKAEQQLEETRRRPQQFLSRMRLVLWREHKHESANSQVLVNTSLAWIATQLPRT